MATETAKAPAKATPLTLQQKFVKLREAVPAIAQKKHSEGVKYKFAKIFDVYELLTPAMNEYGVNFDIVGEQATRHAENGDGIFYHSYEQKTYNGSRLVWVYEADLLVRWTNADNPDETLDVTLHAIGTNDGGPDKAKGSAWTYCLKYYFFEKFGIDQGEDDPDNTDRTNGQPPQPPTNGARGNNTPPAKANAPQRTTAAPTLTDAQIQRMYAKATAAGFTAEQTNARIAKKYGQADPRYLTPAQYEEICAAFDTAVKKNETTDQESKEDANNG